LAAAFLKRLWTVLLPALLVGCGNIHKKNLSDNSLIQRAAQTLKITPDTLTLSNRRAYGISELVLTLPSRMTYSVIPVPFGLMTISLRAGACHR